MIHILASEAQRGHRDESNRVDWSFHPMGIAQSNDNRTPYHLPPVLNVTVEPHSMHRSNSRVLSFLFVSLLIISPA